MSWHRHPGVRSGKELSRGERAADHVRNVMGSWSFIGYQTLFILLWAIGNVISLRGLGLPHWDPYPFILLNLVFSTQAAYASPIILLSQKRADANAAELAQHDFQTNQDALAEIRKDAEINRQALATLTQLVERMAALESQILSRKDTPE